MNKKSKSRATQDKQFLKVTNDYLRYATQITDNKDEALRLTGLIAILSYYFSLKEFSVPMMRATNEDNYKYGGWRVFIHKNHIKEGFDCFDSVWTSLCNSGYLTRHKVPTGGTDKFMHDYFINEKPNAHNTYNFDYSTFKKCYKKGYSYFYNGKWTKFIEDGKYIPEKFLNGKKVRSYPLRKDVVQRATLPTDDFTMVCLDVLLSPDLTLEEKAMFMFIQRLLDLEESGQLHAPLTKTMIFDSIKDCVNAKEMAWRGLIRKGYLHGDPVYKRGQRGIYCYSYSLTAPPQVKRAVITYIEEADSEILITKDNKKIKIPQKPLPDKEIQKVNYRNDEYLEFDNELSKLKEQLNYYKMLENLPHMAINLKAADIDYTLDLLTDYMIDSKHPLKPAKDRIKAIMAFKELDSGTFLSILNRCFKRINDTTHNEPIRSVDGYLLSCLYQEQISGLTSSKTHTQGDIELDSGEYEKLVTKFKTDKTS